MKFKMSSSTSQFKNKILENKSPKKILGALFYGLLFFKDFYPL